MLLAILLDVIVQAFSFIAQRGFKHPAKRLALAIADLKKSNAPDNLVVEAELKQISAIVFDDFGGLVSIRQHAAEVLGFSENF